MGFCISSVKQSQTTMIYFKEHITTFEKLPRPLLWEIIRYEPTNFFTLECTAFRFKEKLTNDVSYFHYFLECTYEKNGLRDLCYDECKR